MSKKYSKYRKKKIGSYIPKINFAQFEKKWYHKLKNISNCFVYDKTMETYHKYHSSFF